MSFVARCLYCRRETLAPDEDVGRSVRCQGCDSFFVLVPELNARAPAVVRTPPPSDPAPLPQSATKSVPKLKAAAVAELDWPAREGKPARDAAPEAVPGEIGTGGWAVAGGACGCAVLAGVSGSVTGMTGLLIPLAVGGAAVGLLAVVLFLARGASPAELAVPAIPSVGCLLLLLVALVAPDFLSPQYEAARQRPTDDPDAVRYLPLSGELVDPATLVPADGWADARRVGVQQGAIRIDVTAASVGPVELVGQKGSTKERYLTVALRVRHTGVGGPVAFAAWGATVPRAVPDAKLTAGGKTVGQAALGGKALAGALYNGLELTPLSAAVTKLTFDPPPAGEAVRLELPAEAWGKTGAFRFHIPAAMIAVAAPPKPKAK